MAGTLHPPGGSLRWRKCDEIRVWFLRVLTHKECLQLRFLEVKAECFLGGNLLAIIRGCLIEWLGSWSRRLRIPGSNLACILPRDGFVLASPVFHSLATPSKWFTSSFRPLLILPFRFSIFVVQIYISFWWHIKIANFKLDSQVKKQCNVHRIERKIESWTGIENLTSQIPDERSNHWAAERLVKNKAIPSK